MNRLIISTVGTSLATNCLKDDKSQIFAKKSWAEDISPLANKLDEYLQQNKQLLDDINERRKLSAELNSLEALKITSDDELIFIATDTAQGKWISEKLTQIVTDLYQLKHKPKIKRIEGLQVHDEQLMRTQGLKNFISEILAIVDDENQRYAHEFIFNATGGFKSVVPFLTIMGMLYKVKTVYIFETSNSLIHLPPLPFSFDLDLFAKVRPALEYIEQETAVSEQEYFSKIVDCTIEERDLYLSFVEPMDNQVTLSPLAYSLLTIEKQAEKSKVAQSVIDTLKQIKGQAKKAIEDMIDKSASPLWRTQKYHSFSGTDLTVLKAGNTAERIAGFIKDNRFYVAVVFADHDEYEKTLKNYQKADFNNVEFVEWQ